MATSNMKSAGKSAAKSTTAVTVQAQTAMVVENRPDWMPAVGGPSRGSEQVTANDLVIPRLEVVQALSAIRQRSDPSYVEGAQEGDLYNTVTREIYGNSVTVCPVYFRPTWQVWVDRERSKTAGGFRGSFSSPDAALARVDGADEPLEVVPVGEHYVIVLNPSGKMEEAVISMGRSKAKVSRRWNSLVRLAGGDRFSRVYVVSSVADKSQNNDSFYNLAVDIGKWPSRELYRAAEALYEQIASGEQSVVAHVPPEYMDPDGQPDSGGGF